MNNLARADTLFEQVTARSHGGNLVTVAVSLYNYAKYLPECLNSIAAQRHRNLDIIVVDDASQKDDSIEVARKWLEVHADRFRPRTAVGARQEPGPRPGAQHGVRACPWRSDFRNRRGQ